MSAAPYRVILEDCRAPVKTLVGEEGQGFEYAKRCLAEGRTTLAAHCVGATRTALELALEHGGQRQTFGKPFADHQAILFTLPTIGVGAGRSGEHPAWFQLRFVAA